MAQSIERFRPTYRARSVALIDFETLAGMGIRFAVVDFDGTVTPPLSPNVCPDSIQNLLGAKANNWLIDVCLLSNCLLYFMSGRVQATARATGFNHLACCLPGPIKPHGQAFERALSRMSGATVDNSIVIGDQFGTDILGANRLGIPSIWVPSIEPIPLWKRITLEVINQRRLRALGEIPEAPTRVY